MKLFEPAEIGKLSIRNRVVMLPMMTRLNEPEGRISQRAIDFFEARAKGGTGLIIAAMWAVNRKVDIAEGGGPHSGVFIADSDYFLEGLTKLVDAVHKYGAKIAIQLTAGHGRVAWPYGLAKGAVVPSEQPCFYDPKITARQLSIEEVSRLAEGFGVTAKIVSLAGVDAVEIHGHCGYLIDQFMTPAWNRRNDRYGRSLEKRLRFPLDIIESIQASTGRDFPIIFRMSVTHNYEGGRDVEESVEIARCLEKAGVAAINANASCYDAPTVLQYPTYDPPGNWVHLAEAVKKAVKIPVITAGKLGYPELAEGILQEKKADFIGLARALLADPEWPNKVKESRPDDILMCIGCNECMRMIATSHPIGCAVNPLTGREKEIALTKGKKKKRVLVVGGGLVGCELAVFLSQRGKKVTIIEAGETLLPNEFEFNRTDLLLILNESGVNILTKHQLVEITDDGPVISDNSRKRLLKADTVFLRLHRGYGRFYYPDSDVRPTDFVWGFLQTDIKRV